MAIKRTQILIQILIKNPLPQKNQDSIYIPGLSFIYIADSDNSDKTCQSNTPRRCSYDHQEGIKEKGFDLQMLQVLLTGKILSSPQEVCLKAETSNSEAGALMPGFGHNTVSNCIH